MSPSVLKHKAIRVIFKYIAKDKFIDINDCPIDNGGKYYMKLLYNPVADLETSLRGILSGYKSQQGKPYFFKSWET